MKQLIYSLFLLSVVSLASCNLDKEVEIDLPPFESKLVTECYIESGSNIQLALTQSQNYFTTADSGILKSLFINDAEVVINYEGIDHKMDFNPMIDFKEMKWFNYKLNDSLDLKPGVPIYLRITDKKGRSISGETSYMNPVKIDSAKFFNKDDTATYVLCYFTDKSPLKDYYRFRVRKLNDSSKVMLDYATDDEIFNNKTAVLGSSPSFKKGDTAEVTLYTISKEYYNFINTVRSAQSSNGNPFAPPGVIESTVKGGLGVFTTTPYDRIIIVF